MFMPCFRVWHRSYGATVPIFDSKKVRLRAL